MSFPLSPAPAWFSRVTTAKRANTFVSGESIAFSAVPSAATAYTVRNYDGAVVASGSLSSQTTLTLGTVGTGVYATFGWYRLYFTGPSSDANFGNSYGVVSFACMSNSAHFPVVSAAANGQAQYQERYASAVLAANPARWGITDCIDPTINIGGFSLADVQAGAALDATYWQNASYAESARPRSGLVEYLNGAVDRTEIFATGSHVATFYDLISRADSATSVGTPDIGAYVVGTGTWGVSGGALYSPVLAGPSLLYFQIVNGTGSTTGDFSATQNFEVKFTALGGPGNGVIFRGVDSSNFYLAHETGITKYVAGVGTSVASWTQIASGDVMRLNIGAAGSAFLCQIFINGRRVSAFADYTYMTTGQKAGLYVTSTAAKFSGFSSGFSYNGGVALAAYPATPNQTGTSLKITPGGTSGFKISVYSPNPSTLVETFDNLATSAAAETAVNGTSAYLRVFSGSNNSPVPNGNMIGIVNQTYQALASAVATLYPSIKYFEGPINEPNGSQSPMWTGAQTAHAMHLFQAGVHAGNASAQAVGPGSVNILGSWYAEFFAAGGGAYCDAISFHFYNCALGDLASGRRNVDNFKALLTSYGLQNKALWQTENGSTPANVYGIFHPRRSRWWIFNVLILEQLGCPREQNYPFNDTSHGDWNFPAWLYAASGPTPSAVMQRTLVDETFNRPYAGRINFGTPGDELYLGSRYTGSDGTSTLVFMSCSPQLVGRVVLTISGATSLSVVDTWGNVTTVPVTSGKAVLPVQDSPVYVRLPSGATATLYSFGDWPPLAAPTVGTHPTLRGGSTAHLGSGSAQTVPSLSDGAWANGYDNTPGSYNDPAAMPSWVRIDLGRTQIFDRVTIWSGFYWQSLSALVDFDVQTSLNGTSWTTQKTVTRPTPSSFAHGDDSAGTGCQRETFDPEMWIFDMKLAAKVAARYVRVYVRAASYGGEPDSASNSIGGQGGTPSLTVQEIGVYCDDTATPRYVTVS